MSIILDLLKSSAAQGLTVEELTKLLFQSLEGFRKTRTRTIARTETNKVENWGIKEGYKQNPFIEAEGWLSAFLDTTRAAHIEADNKYSEDPKPLDEPFEVDGENLKYPGDPAGSAGNTINCVCTTYPKVREI
jgi:hypothetical protein